MTIATAIGSMVLLTSMIGLIEGMQAFRSCDSEMWKREQGTLALRKISNNLQQSVGASVQIQSHAGGPVSTYGSCVSMNLPQNNQTVAYYIYPYSTAGITSTNSTLYFSSTGAINPATDIKMLSNIVDLEIRDNLTGAPSYRIGFKVATIGWLYFSEPNCPAYLNQLEFTTSAMPRN